MRAIWQFHLVKFTSTFHFEIVYLSWCAFSGILDVTFWHAREKRVKFRWFNLKRREKNRLLFIVIRFLGLLQYVETKWMRMMSNELFFLGAYVITIDFKCIYTSYKNKLFSPTLKYVNFAVSLPKKVSKIIFNLAELFSNFRMQVTFWRKFNFFLVSNEK